MSSDVQNPDCEAVRDTRGKDKRTHNKPLQWFFMALVSSGLQGIMIGQFASAGIVGSSASQLASALSQGICINILSTAQVQTVDAGTAGAGTGVSKVIGINPGALTPMMIGQFASQGLIGPYSAGLARAISTAFCTWFLASNQTSTVHSGVGLGVGNGKVIGLSPSAMGNMIRGMMAANGLLGTYSPKIATAVGTAIASHVLAMGVVVTPILGPPSIAPGAGSGFGKVL